jgi:hypothetical protein
VGGAGCSTGGGSGSPEVPLHRGHVNGQAPRLQRRSLQSTSAAGSSKMEIVGEVSGRSVRGGDDGGLDASGDVRSSVNLGL